MSRVLCLSLLFAVFALPAHAEEASLSAGFPKTAIWVSKSAPIDGDKVKVFTPAYNSTEHALTADAVFTVDGAVFGTARVELNAGESKIVSVEWKTTVGTHILAVKIENAVNTKTKEAVSVIHGITEGISIQVAEAPPKPLALQILATAVQATTAAVETAVPIVSSVLGAVFEKTEGLRSGAIVSLERSLDIKSAEEKLEGQVLGAEIFRDPAALTAAVSAASATSSITQFFLRVLLVITQSIWIFYSLITIFLLFLLFIIAKTVSRPRPALRY